jgi:hypothetical protein
MDLKYGTIVRLVGSRNGSRHGEEVSMVVSQEVLDYDKHDYHEVLVLTSDFGFSPIGLVTVRDIDERFDIIEQPDE